jgi:hypothetical protein
MAGAQGPSVEEAMATTCSEGYAAIEIDESETQRQMAQ